MQAAQLITQMLGAPPVQLQFERVLCPFLLLHVNRYAGEWEKYSMSFLWMQHELIEVCNLDSGLGTGCYLCCTPRGTWVGEGWAAGHANAALS